MLIKSVRLLVFISSFLIRVSTVAHSVPAENLLLTAPQSPVLEIGTNFTATCWINGAPELTVDDLYWTHSRAVIAEEHYTKINRTALQVTIPVTASQEKPDLLLCRCKEKSSLAQVNRGRCQHGIFMMKSCECCVFRVILWILSHSLTTFVNEWLQFAGYRLHTFTTEFKNDCYYIKGPKHHIQWQNVKWNTKAWDTKYFDWIKIVNYNKHLIYQVLNKEPIFFLISDGTSVVNIYETIFLCLQLHYF